MTTTHPPATQVIGETAAGTATATAYLAGVAVGYLHRHAAPLALFALAVSLTRAHRPDRPRR